ncbi:MAG: hypothetical protein RUMPE_00057 [Eubacteriales bacterium SKADARSKE-1]|nr:hypothetical protein [Eubacteriales bacterium SKADARSKE-1]
MSLCSFAVSTCFADGTTPETQEVRAEQVVDQKVEKLAKEEVASALKNLSKEEITAILEATKSQGKEKPNLNTPDSAKSDSLTASRQLAKDMVRGAWNGFKFTAKLGAYLGAIGGFFAGTASTANLAFGLLCALPGAIVGSIGTVAIAGWVPIVIGALFAI